MSLHVTINGVARSRSILNLDDPNTKIYEAHYGMTQEWANQLLVWAIPPNLPLSYDRITGEVDYTLGQLAAQAPGQIHETFHFVLNNTVVKDNRIPPYGMTYDEARKRNTLPVPATQYRQPGRWRNLQLLGRASRSTRRPGPHTAQISLLYQPTSWEYIQFLYLANNGQNAFLPTKGQFAERLEKHRDG